MLEDFEESMCNAVDEVVTKHVNRFFCNKPQFRQGKPISLSFDEFNEVITSLDADSSIAMEKVMQNYNFGYSPEILVIVMNAGVSTQRKFLEQTLIEIPNPVEYK
jgi:hypothetical protein